VKSLFSLLNAPYFLAAGAPGRTLWARAPVVLTGQGKWLSFIRHFKALTFTIANVKSIPTGLPPRARTP